MLSGAVGVVVFHGAFHILADIERPLCGIVVPPPDERLVVGGGMSYLPIELRHTIVYPSLLCPEHHVGIEVVVVLQALGAAAGGIAAAVAEDTEGRHAELDPGFALMDGLAQLLYEMVHIFAAPVGQASRPAAIASVLSSIVDYLATDRIRIEIIVDMETVDIIAADDIVDHPADIVAVLRLPRIEDILSVVSEDAARFSCCNMVGGQLMGGLGLCPIRIDPRMEFHAPFVALVYHPLERIPVRRRCQPLLSGEETAPRLQFAGVERIALRSYLEDDGVDAVLLQFVELIRQRALHFLGRHTEELSVHALYPCSSELSLLLRAVGRYGLVGVAGGEEEENRSDFQECGSDSS